MSLERVVLKKGNITQAFDINAAAYLQTKGWEKVAKARAKINPAVSKDTPTKSTKKTEDK